MSLQKMTAVAACATLVTSSLRDGWDITRMLRQKKRLNTEEREAVKLLDDLEDLVEDGVLSEGEYEHYCDMLEFALKDKNVTEVRRLQGEMARLRNTVESSPAAHRPPPVHHPDDIDPELAKQRQQLIRRHTSEGHSYQVPQYQPAPRPSGPMRHASLQHHPAQYPPAPPTQPPEQQPRRAHAHFYP